MAIGRSKHQNTQLYPAKVPTGSVNTTDTCDIIVDALGQKSAAMSTQALYASRNTWGKAITPI